MNSPILNRIYTGLIGLLTLTGGVFFCAGFILKIFETNLEIALEKNPIKDLIIIGVIPILGGLLLMCVALKPKKRKTNHSNQPSL